MAFSQQNPFQQRRKMGRNPNNNYGYWNEQVASGGYGYGGGNKDGPPQYPPWPQNYGNYGQHMYQQFGYPYAQGGWVGSGGSDYMNNRRNDREARRQRPQTHHDPSQHIQQPGKIPKIRMSNFVINPIDRTQPLLIGGNGDTNACYARTPLNAWELFSFIPFEKAPKHYAVVSMPLLGQIILFNQKQFSILHCMNSNGEKFNHPSQYIWNTKLTDTWTEMWSGAHKNTLFHANLTIVVEDEIHIIDDKFQHYVIYNAGTQQFRTSGVEVPRKPMNLKDTRIHFIGIISKREERYQQQDGSEGTATIYNFLMWAHTRETDQFYYYTIEYNITFRHFVPSERIQWTQINFIGDSPPIDYAFSACLNLGCYFELHENKILFFGGKEWEIDKFMNKIFCIDYNTRQWSVLPQKLPLGGWWNAALLLGDTITAYLTAVKDPCAFELKLSTIFPKQKAIALLQQQAENPNYQEELEKQQEFSDLASSQIPNKQEPSVQQQMQQYMQTNKQQQQNATNNDDDDDNNNNNNNNNNNITLNDEAQQPPPQKKLKLESGEGVAT